MRLWSWRSIGKSKSLFRGLGGKLALLNMVISGAILIVIAMAALGFAERFVAQQSTRDLSIYARSVQAYLSRADEPLDADDTPLQLSEKYHAYFEGPNGQWDVVFSPSPNIGAEDLSALIEDLRSRREAGAQLWTEEGVAGSGFRFSVIGARRLAAQDSQAETPGGAGTLIVLQDRADEMALRVRLRWLFAGLTALGMILIVLSSLHVSRQAIRPIEESIRQQRAFVAAASHELRTPVTALAANAEVLADAPLGEFEPYLDSIREVAQRMSRLISDLIDLARSDADELSIQMEPIDAEEAAADMLRWMRPLADRQGIRVRESLEGAYMLGDAGRLRQILLALMDNALRYTPEGGEIAVTVRRAGRHVAIAVSDTGIGIPDESKPFVFDRFYRLDAARARQSGGAGLGLSVVKQLALGMKGSVSVSDNPGGGTVFELRFRQAE